MDLSLLGDQHSTMQQIHPALDVVDDTLYVTIRTAIAGKATAIVLSSAGEAFGPAEWADHCAQHALLPISPGEPRRCAPRWHAAGMRATLEGLQAGGQKNVGEAPRWPDTYEAIHRALADHLQVRDERYLTLLALFGMMTYVHPLFDFLPILHLRGPAESGKSRAARALAGIAFNAAIAGYSTPATLFRQAHEGRYTQILTEADHLATATSADAFVRQLQSACS